MFEKRIFELQARLRRIWRWRLDTDKEKGPGIKRTQPNEFTTVWYWNRILPAHTLLPPAWFMKRNTNMSQLKQIYCWSTTLATTFRLTGAKPPFICVEGKCKTSQRLATGICSVRQFPQQLKTIRERFDTLGDGQRWS